MDYFEFDDITRARINDAMKNGDSIPDIIAEEKFAQPLRSPENKMRRAIDGKEWEDAVAIFAAHYPDKRLECVWTPNENHSGCSIFDAGRFRVGVDSDGKVILNWSANGATVHREAHWG